MTEEHITEDKETQRVLYRRKTNPLCSKRLAKKFGQSLETDSSHYPASVVLKWQDGPSTKTARKYIEDKKRTGTFAKGCRVTYDRTYSQDAKLRGLGLAARTGLSDSLSSWAKIKIMLDDEDL